jgi:glycosyltransferase involved in cell wall biosynthesis
MDYWYLSRAPKYINKNMIKVAYLSEGTSLYDCFFLKHLSRFLDIVFLSINQNPKHLCIEIPFVKLPALIKQLPIHDSPRRYLMTPFNVLLLKQVLSNIKPHVLIGCDGLYYGFYAALSKFKPFILFIWGSEVLVWPKFFFLRALVKHSIKKADLVLVDSFIQYKACVALGCNPDKIVVIPWLDSKEMEENVKKAREEKDVFRRIFGWKPNDIVVISTRWHEKIYNIETLIKSIPIVIQNIPNVRFLLLGKGSLTSKLMGMVREMGLDEVVRFIGTVPHDKIFYYLRNSDIYVSTSLSDGTSASLLEAMISGLACVVSDIPGNREWIIDGVNGLLFPAKDYIKLAQKIIFLAKDNELRKRLGENAITAVRKRADWENNAKTLYEKLVNLLRIYGKA